MTVFLFLILACKLFLILKKLFYVAVLDNNFSSLSGHADN